jgi:hypothetical protein
MTTSDPEQPSQPFAREQDEIIETTAVELTDPREHRLRIGRIEDGNQRTANHLRTATLEHRHEHVQLARFRHRDRATRQTLLLHAL